MSLRNRQTIRLSLDKAHRFYEDELGGNMMKMAIQATVTALALQGCATTATQSADPASLDTLQLCRALTEPHDEDYRERVATLLVKRGATVERCQKIIQADNALATGIAVVGAATAIGVAANNGGGGGFYAPGAYGTAWDALRGEYGQWMWRCRDRADGRFVDDYHCAGKPMNDNTWPGPY